MPRLLGLGRTKGASGSGSSSSDSAMSEKESEGGKQGATLEEVVQNAMEAKRSSSHGKKRAAMRKLFRKAIGGSSHQDTSDAENGGQERSGGAENDQQQEQCEKARSVKQVDTEGEKQQKKGVSKGNEVFNMAEKGKSRTTPNKVTKEDKKEQKQPDDQHDMAKVVQEAIKQQADAKTMDEKRKGIRKLFLKAVGKSTDKKDKFNTEGTRDDRSQDDPSAELEPRAKLEKPIKDGMADIVQQAQDQREGKQSGKKRAAIRSAFRKAIGKRSNEEKNADGKLEEDLNDYQEYDAKRRDNSSKASGDDNESRGEQDGQGIDTQDEKRPGKKRDAIRKLFKKAASKGTSVPDNVADPAEEVEDQQARLKTTEIDSCSKTENPTVDNDASNLEQSTDENHDDLPSPKRRMSQVLMELEATGSQRRSGRKRAAIRKLLRKAVGKSSKRADGPRESEVESLEEEKNDSICSLTEAAIADQSSHGKNDKAPETRPEMEAEMSLMFPIEFATSLLTAIEKFDQPGSHKDNKTASERALNMACYSFASRIFAQCGCHYASQSTLDKIFPNCKFPPGVTLGNAVMETVGRIVLANQESGSEAVPLLCKGQHISELPESMSDFLCAVKTHEHYLGYVGFLDFLAAMLNSGPPGSEEEATRTLWALLAQIKYAESGHKLSVVHEMGEDYPSDGELHQNEVKEGEYDSYSGDLQHSVTRQRRSSSGASKAVGRYAIAIFDFEGKKQETDLVLRIGDRVLVHKEYQDGWCTGTLVRTRQQGEFPSSFVQFEDAESSELVLEALTKVLLSDCKTPEDSAQALKNIAQNLDRALEEQRPLNELALI